MPRYSHWIILTGLALTFVPFLIAQPADDPILQKVRQDALHATNPADRLAAIQKINMNPWGGMNDTLFAALSDSDPKVRAAAASLPERITQSSYPHFKDAIIKLDDLAHNDPDVSVRGVAGMALIHPLPVRLANRSFQETIKAGDVAEKTKIAQVIAIIAPNLHPNDDVEGTGRILRELAADPDQKIAQQALIATTRFFYWYHPQEFAVPLIMESLPHPRCLQPPARAAMLDTACFLGRDTWAKPEYLKALREHSDAEFAGAVALGCEQLVGDRLDPAKLVQAEVAEHLLSSSSSRVRRMAAYSLLTPSQADPTRVRRGVNALILIAQGQDQDLAADALTMLYAYCGGGMEHYLALWNKYEVSREWPRDPQLYGILKRLYGDRTSAGRVKAIGDLSALGYQSVARLWREVSWVLRVDDAEVRAAGFAMARAALPEIVREAAQRLDAPVAPSTPKAFYTIDLGRTWFAAPKVPTSRMKKDGRPAYEVVIFACTKCKTSFPAYLMRIADDQATAVEAEASLQTSEARERRIRAAEYAAPGSNQWIRPAPGQGPEQLFRPACPKGCKAMAQQATPSD